MKLRTHKQIVSFIGNKGKSYKELFRVVDMRYYWKLYRQGLFYFDEISSLHKVRHTRQ